MQGLVYIFIALAALAVAVMAYFGFTFSPIDAVVTGIVFALACVVVLERQLRQRTEARFERAISEFSRLLSTDAQAGQMLSQRINALTDVNAQQRLEAVEADISVLGTVVRQVAEAVAEIEQDRRAPSQPGKPRPEEDRLPEPAISLDMLKRALDEERIVYHSQAIVTLPHRRNYGYDLVPRLVLEDGELADPPEYMPLQGGESLVRRIERGAIEEAVIMARRARMTGQAITLFCPLSHATLADRDGTDRLLALLDANRVIIESLLFGVAETDWRGWSPVAKDAAKQLAKKGAGFSLLGMRSLRHDFAELGGQGVRSARTDVVRFVNEPTSLTDFHVSDIAAYVKRYGIDLIVTGVRTEQQVLTLLEDGIGLVQGPHLGLPVPIRTELGAAPA